MGLLVKHARNKHGRKIGTVVAFAHEDRILVGCSRCNRKAGDRFDSQEGVDLAVLNAYEPGTLLFEKSVIPSLRDEVLRMIDRANDYFKQCRKASLKSKEPPRWVYELHPSWAHSVSIEKKPPQAFGTVTFGNYEVKNPFVMSNEEAKKFEWKN